MMARRLRLDGYTRVSRVGGREGEGFISPQVQTEAMEKWATANGHSLTVHEPELDVSGGTMDRPTFNHILQRIESGESDGVIVYRVDRFARSLLGALTTLEEIAKAGGTFASVQDAIDMTTAQGRAFLQMQLVFAELFRGQIREQFDTATSRAVGRGVHISNVVPVGYDRVDQRLVPNKAAPVIRDLFHRRAAGEGCSQLARFLDGALPRPNGQLWTPAHVGRLLKMRVYLGEAHYGAHRNPDAHEPIVTEADFQRASLARAPSNGRSERTTLLAGLVRCASCRYLMTPAKSGKDRSTLVYRCREKHTAGRCPAPAVVSRGRIEEYVEREAKAVLSGGSVPGVVSTADFDAASKHLAAVTAERDAFAADVTARSILGDKAYHEALKSRADAVSDAERELSQQIGTAAPAGVTLEEWDELTTDERRMVLTAMVDAVFVRKAPGKPSIESRALIAWRGDGPDDLPRRGRANGVVRGYAWPEGEAGVTASQDRSDGA